MFACHQAKVDDRGWACPCCTRSFEEEKEFDDFKNQMKMLASEESPLLTLDERNKTARANYAEWKEIVSEHSPAILEYRRIANEVNDLENNIHELNKGLGQTNNQLDDIKETASDIESQVSSLRDLLDSAKRWAEAASRIAEKRMQVNQKQDDLSMNTADTDGRDLQGVEREINEKTDQREQHTNQVSGYVSVFARYSFWRWLTFTNLLHRLTSSTRK